MTMPVPVGGTLWLHLDEKAVHVVDSAVILHSTYAIDDAAVVPGHEPRDPRVSKESP